MVVEAVGRNAQDVPVIARWSLVAEATRGPHVPTLAALALVRRLRDGRLDLRGAGPCVGVLSLEDFRKDFERLGIATAAVVTPPPPAPFKRALAERFAELPTVTQAIHLPDPILLLAGVANVDGAETPAGRWIAGLFGFPEAARDVPLHVTIEVTSDGTERWARVYPTRVMRSVMTDPDPKRHTVHERFGAFRFRLRLDADSRGLTLTPEAGWWHGLRLPLALLPRIAARESVDQERHLFDVTIGLPMVGRLVRYRGHLTHR